MKVIDRKPVPIYEAKCSECHSKIEYKASEVSFTGYITCPVCGMNIWGSICCPVRMDSEENGVPSIDAVLVKRRGVGYTGIDDDYLISIKEVIDITAETGAIETQRRIKELIPIDAVEVVRCKDCKHRYHLIECPCQSYDHFYSWMPADDWFCKKGERKEE